MARKKQAGTAALVALEKTGLSYTLHTFEVTGTHYGEEAAGALQAAKERVFKTLVVDLTAGKGPRRELAVCCLPVSHELSLKKAAKAHGVSKVTMADPKLAERSSGYVVGGISPIGQKNPLPTVIDHSATNWDTIFVSGGRRGLDIELSAQALQQATNAQLADLVAD
ncbi:Cys-tRNA(Pro)/Cys-tRNA(Cys) deacylase YbaK [Corynebacterium kalinowskii]|uniref:Cys-tRNA(Pro)/Cys-tRNA(Cys) deacylase n=1 Tax=Corynebacterium kalinowskii TaxID=2675216 RepID=A0A6B8VBX5_9CORY|nr:Cys-tRNA(Pro) deacylase [Corynebacterium kalinowskii]QGU02672.1 Cys-tRNA(Pro)/Cys-tRNA(Cys) deacylase YbaK [Corynebacterium kalinowskii]